MRAALTEVWKRVCGGVSSRFIFSPSFLLFLSSGARFLPFMLRGFQEGSCRVLLRRSFHCCCRALGYSSGVLGLCCPQMAGNSPGFIPSSSEMDVFSTSQQPYVMVGMEKGTEAYSELLSGIYCCLSLCSAPECKFPNRLITKGAVWGSRFIY